MLLHSFALSFDGAHLEQDLKHDKVNDVVSGAGKRSVRFDADDDILTEMMPFYIRSIAYCQFRYCLFTVSVTQMNEKEFGDIMEKVSAELDTALAKHGGKVVAYVCDRHPTQIAVLNKLNLPRLHDWGHIFKNCLSALIN